MGPGYECVAEFVVIKTRHLAGNPVGILGELRFEDVPEVLHVSSATLALTDCPTRPGGDGR